MNFQNVVTKLMLFASALALAPVATAQDAASDDEVIEEVIFGGTYRF